MSKLTSLLLMLALVLCSFNSTTVSGQPKSYFSRHKNEPNISYVMLALKLLMCGSGGYATFTGIDALRADKNNYGAMAFTVGGSLMLMSFVPGVYDDFKKLLSQNPPSVLFAAIDSVVQRLGIAVRMVSKLAIGAFFVERALDGMNAQQWRALKVIGNGLVAYKCLESANSDFNQLT